jgi:hypothetical protein
MRPDEEGEGSSEAPSRDGRGDAQRLADFHLDWVYPPIRPNGMDRAIEPQLDRELPPPRPGLP